MNTVQKQIESFGSLVNVSNELFHLCVIPWDFIKPRPMRYSWAAS
jgi:hypothetical protein